MRQREKSTDPGQFRAGKGQVRLFSHMKKNQENQGVPGLPGHLGQVGQVFLGFPYMRVRDYILRFFLP